MAHPFGCGAPPVSIPANIAEGFTKRGKPDKVRLIDMAERSLEECRYYLISAEDLGYGQNEKLTSLLEEVSLTLRPIGRPLLTIDS